MESDTKLWLEQLKGMDDEKDVEDFLKDIFQKGMSAAIELFLGVKVG
jgi:hypothetical protein